MRQIDYLIIGAGIAGLGVAYALTKEGAKVLVLEKESFVGGRMSTVTIDGMPIDLGAKFLLPSAYKNISALSSELNIPFRPIPASKFAVMKNGKPLFCDGKNIFSVLQYKGLSLKSKIQVGVLFAWQLMKYKELDIYHLDRAVSLDNQSVYEYFKKWLDQECFEYLLDPMCMSLFAYNTKEFSRAFFLSVLSKMMKAKFYSFDGGINKLCLALAQKFPVMFNIEVNSIIREKNNVTVTAYDRKKKKAIIFHAQKVIIALPGNKVLLVLKNPTEIEKKFFSQIHYSRATIIHFRGKTDGFKNFSTIWFPEKENKHFASIVKNFYSSGEIEENIFELGLRQTYMQELKAKKSFSKDYIAKVIEKELDMQNVNIFYITQWDGMCPKVEPGYLWRRYDFFVRTKNEKQIFYCGDYLENPSTEGALTSGLNLAKRSNFQTRTIDN